ncbi:MAG: hypothetical protein H0U23_04810 [Blastocatellia bacterium]|nr:hypothetical protein [Blastocatellia bacterium]
MPQFNTIIEIYNAKDPENNYGMKITIENVDNCCEGHAENSTTDIAQAITDNLSKIWEEDYHHRILSIDRKEN